MQPGKRRWLIGIPIVLFWLIMTGLLLDRELAHDRSVDLTARPRLEEPTETWLGLFAGERQRVGYIHLQQIPERRRDLDGITMRMAMSMTLHLFGRTTDLDLSGSAWRAYEAATGPVGELELELLSGDSQFRLEGTLFPDRLTGAVLSAGERLPIDLPVDGELLLSGAFGSPLALPDIGLGEQIKVTGFDPMTLDTSDTVVRCVAQEKIEVGGEMVDARVVTIESSGMTSRAWIDEQGEVLRASTPLGLSLEVVSREEALSGAGSGELTNLLDLSAIRPRGATPFRGARAMTVRLGGRAPAELPLDQVQSRADHLTYHVEALAQVEATAHIETSGQLETSAAISSAPVELDAKTIESYLAADAFVQSDHPRIVAQAEAIVEGIEAPLDRAMAIHRWVYRELDKQAVLTVPSALEVLEDRRGDCNEHAVLYTALARAVGIPTRIAIGIVWSVELDGFYYHAWPEIWTEAGWRWTDPTLGQEVADATHLKLLNGGIESWPQLLPYLGQLELEVLEIR